MDELAKKWPNRFEFEQILSEETNDTSWQGLKGYIGEHLQMFATCNSQVYLCGPPLMIDDCMDKLSKLGISTSEMFADRFVANSN